MANGQDTARLLDAQSAAAADVAAATVALQDALYRLTAGMSRAEDATDVADRLAFSSIVRHGFSTGQQTDYLALRAVALQTLDALAVLYPAVAAAPALLDAMARSAEDYAQSPDASYFAGLADGLQTV